MKKIIKLIAIIIIIMIVILSVNYIRNIMILGKISNEGNRLFNSLNYHITINSKMINSDYNNINEIYYKDNICLINTYTDDKLIEICWKNYLTGECITYYPDTLKTTNDFNDELISSIKDDIMLKNNQISVFNFIIEKDNYYIIKEKNRKSYFDKETGMFVKKEYNFEGTHDVLNNICEVKCQQNNVTDLDVKKPEI